MNRGADKAPRVVYIEYDYVPAFLCCFLHTIQRGIYFAEKYRKTGERKGDSITVACDLQYTYDIKIRYLGKIYKIIFTLYKGP